jgi:tetratricopeptide (TPR) repeat protein
MRYFVKVFIFAVLNIFLFAGLSHAKVVTFEKEYTYQASELDSKASCRTISLAMVKRLLLEELGTYLISETEVKNMQLTKDQVTTYSAGIVSAEVIEEKWDGKTYWLKAKVSADPIEVSKALKKIIDDKYQAKQLEDTRKKAEELVKENVRLKKEIEVLAKAKKRDTKAQAKKVKDYEKIIRWLDAIEWFEKGHSAILAGRYSEAINAMTKAVEIQPDYARAYVVRGFVYNRLGNHQQAIADFKIAARLGNKDAQDFLRKQGEQW